MVTEDDRKPNLRIETKDEKLLASVKVGKKAEFTISGTVTGIDAPEKYHYDGIGKGKDKTRVYPGHIKLQINKVVNNANQMGDISDLMDKDED